MRLTRREFGELTAGSLAGAMLPRSVEAAGPLSDMPAGAIDVHNHIVGPRSKYPMAPNRTYTPPEASVAQLRALRARLGVSRNVIVQPSFYGFDNACLVDALAELGTSARGIAVVPLNVTDTELQRLASRGVSGVRLNLATFGIHDPKVAADAAHAFATRLVPLGWHIQINTDLQVIDGLAPMLADIKVPVVFDHVGNADAALGVNQKGFGALVALVRARNTYVKLSAPYNLSKRADWADVVPLAKALIEAGPDRMLWGTNWPHPGRRRDDIAEITPYLVVDNAKLLVHFAQQCSDAAMRKMILVDTPQRLYRFASGTGARLGVAVNACV
jgi:predicted TIM-barrel fold metal-dependent hydrolase